MNLKLCLKKSCKTFFVENLFVKNQIKNIISSSKINTDQLCLPIVRKKHNFSTIKSGRSTENDSIIISDHELSNQSIKSQD